MDLISIIVPAYNVELYISECLDYILKQTYQNFEVIIVNDGSTDHTGEICRDYSRKDPRIKVITVNNGGVAKARNIGLEQASGNYITFIDPDDFVVETYLSEMYEISQKEHADLVIGLHYTFVEEESVFKFLYTDKIYQGRLSFLEVLANMNVNNSEVFVPDWTYYTPTAKLFKSTLFDGVRFPANIVYEDAAILHKLYLKANIIFQIPRSIYCYRIRKNSITKSEKRLLNVQSILYICRERIADLYMHGIDPMNDYRFLTYHLKLAKQILVDKNWIHLVEYHQVLEFLNSLENLKRCAN